MRCSSKRGVSPVSGNQSAFLIENLKNSEQNLSLNRGVLRKDSNF